jgi:hypothetical protein
MTKKNDPALLTSICELVASTGATPKEAANKLGVSTSSYHSWITQAGKNPTEWMVSLASEEMPLLQALGLARRLYLHDALAKFEQYCAEGEEIPLIYRGKFSWKEREDLVGLDQEMLERLGYRDNLERDADGNRIRETYRQRAPMQAIIKMLESNFRAYSPRSEVVQRTIHSGGVTVVPKQSAPPTPVTVVAPTAIAPPTEEDIEEASFLDEEPEAISDTVIEMPEPEPTPTPVAEPEPVPTPASAKPLTPLQRDLLERLKRKPANPQPRDIVKVFRVDSSEDRSENNPVNRPGGVKIR